jgi:HD-GYP domain-containing protein (c-di-GMP phosphodiesterase class II)
MDTKNERLTAEQKFLQVFHLLISSARIHLDNNKVLTFSVKQFVNTIKQLTGSSNELLLIFTGGGFYLQEEKLIFKGHSAVFVDFMLQFFQKRELSALKFYDSIQHVPEAEVTSFARFLDQAAQHQDPTVWLEKQIEKNKFSWVEHVQITQISLKGEGKTGIAPEKGFPQDTGETVAGENQAEEEKDKQKGKAPVNGNDPLDGKIQNALQTYGYTVLSLQEVASKISSNKRASIRKPMRLVQNLIDMVMDDNHMLKGLSTIRDYDDYTYTHSINVAILAICLGHALNLSKSSLETLGLSALFHDLGKIDVPKEILNKPGKLTETEFQVIKKHSLDSVRRIIKLQTTHGRKGTIMLPPFEHHLKIDLSGYPKTPRNKPISLFGKIIAISDVFDAITAHRIYRSEPISPDRALGMMLEQSGTGFDPILLKVFINMIGVYPVGTLLKLDNNEIGIVAKYIGHGEQDKELWVQLLNPVSDGSFARGELISLGILNPKSGTFNRPIVETLHPSVYGIQPAEFIM